MRGWKIVVISLLLSLFGRIAGAWETRHNRNGMWHLGVSAYGSKPTTECPVNLAVFVPNQPTTTVIVYFHGYRDTIAKVMKSTEYQLGENQSIVIVPQGPCDTKELRWDRQVLKNLPGLFAEALQKARLEEEPKRTVLVAHSGGYWPAEQVLNSILFNEVWLLDALYGKDFSKFVIWAKNSPSRLLRAACTHRQAEECAELARMGAEVEPAPTTHNRTVGVFVPQWLTKGGKLTASRTHSE